MKRVLIFLVLTALLVGSIISVATSQSADPRIARSTWAKELDYIKNGTMTLLYKTFGSPTLTGTVTNSARNNNTGLWYFSSDGDTMKINLYKGDYVFQTETGNAFQFGIDSAGVVTLKNGGTIDNGTDNAIRLSENSEDLVITFGTNAATLSSATSLATLNTGAIGINIGSSAETITKVDTICTSGGSTSRWLKVTVAGQTFWAPRDTSLVK